MHTAVRKTPFQNVFGNTFIQTIFHKILEEFLKRKWSENGLEILLGKGG